MPAATTPRAFLRGADVDFPSFYDPGSEVLLEFDGSRPTAIPSTAILDRQGRLAALVIGEIPGAVTLRDVDRRRRGRGRLTWLTGSSRPRGPARWSLAIPVAVLAGLVSFFSPCVLPLLPGYLSYATGLSGADLASGDVRRGRMVAGSLLFVLGFSVVFVGLGVLSANVFRFFSTNARTFDIVLGVAGDRARPGVHGPACPLLQRDVRVHRVPAVGLAAAPLLGFLFGLGWTPCIGPTLGVILTLTANETGARGGLLLAFYSLGLGIPFVLAGLAWRRALRTRRLGAPPPALGDRVRRRAARADRRRAAHRPVGRGGRLGADPAGQRLRGERVTARRPPPTPSCTTAAAVRRSGELSLRELLRWGWRQLTSMRTALVLLLLLALAAVPGSVIPQQQVDSLEATRWKEQHETLTPVYERLGLFDVYGSPWFAAIYLLLVAVAGRLHRAAHARLRAGHPAASRPRRRATSPGCPTTRRTAPTPTPAAVLDAARAELKRRGYRLRRAPATPATRSAPSAATCARSATCCSTSPCSSCWSASRSAGCSATRAASSW